jgi:uncharacterized membrane protein YqjE|tara:strand:- start:2370 stop:2639 length:270 start_codon:yes stop_codon:yes gene_type:complete
VNKARIAVLAILTLSVINLCLMIFSNLVGMRAFPDYSPIVMTLFNVFLMTLGLLSVWQLFTGIDGHAMRGAGGVVICECRLVYEGGVCA